MTKNSIKKFLSLLGTTTLVASPIIAMGGGLLDNNPINTNKKVEVDSIEKVSVEKEIVNLEVASAKIGVYPEDPSVGDLVKGDLYYLVLYSADNKPITLADIYKDSNYSTRWDTKPNENDPIYLKSITPSGTISLLLSFDEGASWETVSPYDTYNNDGGSKEFHISLNFNNINYNICNIPSLKGPVWGFANAQVSRVDFSNKQDMIIDQNSFSSSENLTDVIFPENYLYADELPTGLFQYCEKISNIKWPKNITKLPDNCFYLSAVQSITIPETIIEIGVEAFSGMSELTEIHIPANVSLIKNSAFINCTKLKKIYFDGDKADIVVDNDVFKTGYKQLSEDTSGWETTEIHFTTQELAIQYRDKVDIDSSTNTDDKWNVSYVRQTYESDSEKSVIFPEKDTIPNTVSIKTTSHESALQSSTFNLKAEVLNAAGYLVPKKGQRVVWQITSSPIEGIELESNTGVLKWNNLKPNTYKFNVSASCYYSPNPSQEVEFTLIIKGDDPVDPGQDTTPATINIIDTATNKKVANPYWTKDLSGSINLKAQVLNASGQTDGVDQTVTWSLVGSEQWPSISLSEDGVLSWSGLILENDYSFTIVATSKSLDTVKNELSFTLKVTEKVEDNLWSKLMWLWILIIVLALTIIIASTIIIVHNKRKHRRYKDVDADKLMKEINK